MRTLQDKNLLLSVHVVVATERLFITIVCHHVTPGIYIPRVPHTGSLIISWPF